MPWKWTTTPRPLPRRGKTGNIVAPATPRKLGPCTQSIQHSRTLVAPSSTVYHGALVTIVTASGHHMWTVPEDDGWWWDFSFRPDHHLPPGTGPNPHMTYHRPAGDSQDWPIGSVGWPQHSTIGPALDLNHHYIWNIKCLVSPGRTLPDSSSLTFPAHAPCFHVPVHATLSRTQTYGSKAGNPSSDRRDNCPAHSPWIPRPGSPQQCV